MTTKVVHCKRAKYDVYIGRGKGGKVGQWGNPFILTRHTTRDEVIKRYRSHLWKRLKAEPQLRKELLALRGKTLGCWCAPQACHGDVLAKAAEWLHNNPDFNWDTP